MLFPFVLGISMEGQGLLSSADKWDPTLTNSHDPSISNRRRTPGELNMTRIEKTGTTSAILAPVSLGV